MLFIALLAVGSALSLGAKHHHKKNKTTTQNLPKTTTEAPHNSNSGSTKTELAHLKNEISDDEKEINRTFALASVNMGLAGSSLFFHPLLWLTIPIIIYSELPFAKKAYQALKERRVSSYMIDVVLSTALLLGGFLYTAVISVWFALFALKLLVKSENNSKQNLSQLFGEQPRFVWVLTPDGVEIEIPIEDLHLGDIVRVNAGQVIPVDGVISSGFASIDQHKLTGESQPSEKGEGDEVLASTIVLAGQIDIITEKTGKNTVSMQITDVLHQVADFKSTLQSRGEAIADQLTLPTLAAGALFLPVFGYSSAMAVLTNTFGYKMRLFAPASMLSFLNLSSAQGILIKDGRSLEILNKIDTVVFDKTGTLTLEQPTVAKIHTIEGMESNEVLRYAAGAEKGQTHPVAKAILQQAKHAELVIPEGEKARYEMGAGIQVDLDQKTVRVGSETLMNNNELSIPATLQKAQQHAHQYGHSVIFVAFDEQVVGLIELQATLRPEAQQVIDALKEQHLSLYIISGDDEAPTRTLANSLGIAHYFANILPEGKAELISQLQDDGKSVCFIGDGINDSIALKTAHASISLQGAASIATDTAQIVFMDGSLKQLPEVFQLANDYDANVKTNYLISVVPTTVCLGGIVLFHWGVIMGMGITLTTLFVGIGNSLRPLVKRKSLEEDSIVLLDSPSLSSKSTPHNLKED